MSALDNSALPQLINSGELKEKMKELNEKLKESEVELSKAQKKELKKLEKEYLPRLEGYENAMKTWESVIPTSKTNPNTIMRIEGSYGQWTVKTRL